MMADLASASDRSVFGVPEDVFLLRGFLRSLVVDDNLPAQLALSSQAVVVWVVCSVVVVCM